MEDILEEREEEEEVETLWNGITEVVNKAAEEVCGLVEKKI